MLPATGAVIIDDAFLRPSNRDFFESGRDTVGDPHSLDRPLRCLGPQRFLLPSNITIGRDPASVVIHSLVRAFGPSARMRKAIGVEVLCSGQVPALIAKFESTGTPVPLQCHPEVVRSDGHTQLPG